jgi:hypothetical protein
LNLLSALNIVFELATQNALDSTEYETDSALFTEAYKQRLAIEKTHLFIEGMEKAEQWKGSTMPATGSNT